MEAHMAQKNTKNVNGEDMFLSSTSLLKLVGAINGHMNSLEIF